MIQFTSEGKVAIETILRCTKEANDAYKRLSADEQRACREHHLEGDSVEFYLRRGLRAADEIQQAVTERYAPRRHTPEWFDAAFAGLADGQTLPPQLRRLAERFCRDFGVCGICDPMYIVNVAAFELGMGDGLSNFRLAWIAPQPAAVDRLAQRLMFSYSTCIAGRESMVRPLLGEALALVEADRHAVVGHGAGAAAPADDPLFASMRSGQAI